MLHFVYPLFHLYSEKSLSFFSLLTTSPSLPPFSFMYELTSPTLSSPPKCPFLHYPLIFLTHTRPTLLKNIYIQMKFDFASLLLPLSISVDEGLRVFCSSTRLCGLPPLPQQPGVCTHKCTLLLRERNRDGREDGMRRDERDEMESGENEEERMKKDKLWRGFREESKTGCTTAKLIKINKQQIADNTSQDSVL